MQIHAYIPPSKVLLPGNSRAALGQFNSKTAEDHKISNGYNSKLGNKAPLSPLCVTSPTRGGAPVWGSCRRQTEKTRDYETSYGLFSIQDIILPRKRGSHCNRVTAIPKLGAAAAAATPRPI